MPRPRQNPDDLAKRGSRHAKAAAAREQARVAPSAELDQPTNLTPTEAKAWAELVQRPGLTLADAPLVELGARLLARSRTQAASASELSLLRSVLVDLSPPPSRRPPPPKQSTDDESDFRRAR